MKSKESFNTAAKLYDEVRPSYPDYVIDWIIDNTSVTTNDNLLEIAPGTGQATKKFGKRKFKIHAVELGGNLAEILRKNCDDMNVTVDVSPFESWEAQKGTKYKLIYCATAFHWLDPEIKYQKTSDLLYDNGYLVLMWNNPVGTNNLIINRAYKLLFECYPNKPFSLKPKDDEINTQLQNGLKDIEESGHYKVENYLSHKWHLKQSRDKTVRGFYSQSSYLSLANDERKSLTEKLEKLFESLEDVVKTEFCTTVYLCKKIGGGK